MELLYDIFSTDMLPDAAYITIFTMFVPLAGAFMASVIKSRDGRDIAVILTAIVLFVNVLNLLSIASKGGLPSLVLGEPIPGIKIMFFVDPYGAIFALVASFLWIITSIYSVGYLHSNHEPHQNRFHAFFALAIFAAMGISFAGNMFTLFLFYEFMTLCTFPLVTHHGSKEARIAGRTYLVILLSTSILFLLTAILWTWSIAGTTDFEVGGILAGKIGPVATGILLMLYVYGVGKAALMPMHRWLPAAMVAPTPVSALLHAVAVVKAGVFTILKVVVYIFGAKNLSEMISENWWAGGWLVYIAGATIIISSIIALRQDNLKKRLAYSTISQLSYVVMATAILAPKAIMAAAFHIVAHAFGKITLFFAAGSIYTAAHKKNISELNGIGRRMPYTMAAFTIGALSVIGIPPAAGFLTKYYMMLGAFEYGNFFAIIVIIISTVLNAAYFLPIIYAAFFKKEKGSPKHGEAPIAIIIALTITAGMTIGLFMFPDLFLWLGLQPVLAE